MNAYSYCVRSRYGKGWGRGIDPRPTHCHQCGVELPKPPHTGAAGYGCKDEEPAIYPHPGAPALRKDEVITRSKAICYSCCAENNKADMITTGRAVLYLTESADKQYEVTNWPGTLRIHPFRVRPSQGAGFRRRYPRFDVWFTGPDGKLWHGVNQGDNQILRCKRVKGKA